MRRPLPTACVRRSARSLPRSKTLSLPRSKTLRYYRKLANSEMNEPAGNTSTGPASLLESRRPTAFPANATSRQLATLLLRELFSHRAPVPFDAGMFTAPLGPVSGDRRDQIGRRIRCEGHPK